MSSHKVKVVTVLSDNQVQITYRDMTPEEIKLGEFFKKFLGGSKEKKQSSAIVKVTESAIVKFSERRCDENL